MFARTSLLQWCWSKAMETCIDPEGIKHFWGRRDPGHFAFLDFRGAVTPRYWACRFLHPQQLVIFLIYIYSILKNAAKTSV